MKVTKVRVVDSQGEPVTDALVVVSDYQSVWRETDELGQVAMQFDDDQVLSSMVSVKLASGAIYAAQLTFEAGDTKDFTVPSG